jgi:hypothetical protein
MLDGAGDRRSETRPANLPIGCLAQKNAAEGVRYRGPPIPKPPDASAPLLPPLNPRLY